MWPKKKGLITRGETHDLGNRAEMHKVYCVGSSGAPERLGYRPVSR